MAAGKGSRLGDITKDRPKAFLEIKGIKLIEYIISILRYLGIDDIVIVTGYKADEYERLFANDVNIKLVYNPFYEYMNVLGSFFMGQETLKDIDTVYMHADTLCSPDVLKEIIANGGDVVLPIDFKICDEEAMKVRLENEKVVEISKLIPCDAAAGEFIGIAKLSERVMPAIKEASKTLMREKEFASYFEGAIQEIIDSNKYIISTVDMKKRFWGEVDFMADFEYVRDNIPDEMITIANEYKANK